MISTRQTGGAARRIDRSSLPRIDTRTIPTLYVLLMGAWVYGFAALDDSLPPLVVFALLLVAGAIQVAAGLGLGRWEALALAVVPVAIALAAAGRDSTLWVTVTVLMVFPGGPLIAVGILLRGWLAERADDSPDSWLYGERPR
jgi:hypothetical protein